MPERWVMSERVAEEIVEAVLRDLMDRRGIKVPFFEVQESDPDIFEEMKAELAAQVAKVLEKERG